MFARRLTLLKPEMGRSWLSANQHSDVLHIQAIPLEQRHKAYSTAKTYAVLPKLPIPDANHTLKYFLEFAKPLQTRKEFEETKQVVDNFARTELPVLQKLLEKRAATMNNWLTPWWLDIAYLTSRTPLPVVTSPGVMFPRFDFEGEDGQIDYAAKIAQSAIIFYLKINRNELPQDMAGKCPFDMSQYKLLFGTTRIPRKGIDEIRYGYANQNLSRHAVAIKNGHVFSIPVIDQFGAPLSLSELRAHLRNVVVQSAKRQDYCIGIVSSGNRDVWAETYESLLTNPTNSSHLATIEEALFVVCLDRPSEPPKGYTDKDEHSRQALHGGGSKSNSCNRWFDKTIQFVIGYNGYCGLTYEHTPAEGPPIATLMDFICDQFDANTFIENGPPSTETVKRLDFDLNQKLRERIQKNCKSIDAVVEDVDLVAYTFKRYGKNFPKSIRISPDSYIQMAFQLAFYRIHSTVPPTYETATLRKFDEGRTENIRSPNTLAEIFVKKMASGRAPIVDVYDALKAATESHKKYTLECMNGAGMDRHLLAWNLLASAHGLPKPSILETTVYQQMTHFQVSTSQVPTRHFIQMCFGPSAPDCYGVCYNPQETELHFTVSTFKSYGSTSSKRFTKELERALNDMSSICTKAIKEQAKL